MWTDRNYSAWSGFALLRNRGKGISADATANVKMYWFVVIEKPIYRVSHFFAYVLCIWNRRPEWQLWTIQIDVFHWYEWQKTEMSATIIVKNKGKQQLCWVDILWFLTDAAEGQRGSIPSDSMGARQTAYLKPNRGMRLDICPFAPLAPETPPNRVYLRRHWPQRIVNHKVRTKIFRIALMYPILLQEKTIGVNPEAKKITDAQKNLSNCLGGSLQRGWLKYGGNVAQEASGLGKKKKCLDNFLIDKFLIWFDEFLIDKKCLYIIYMIWWEQSQLPKLNI